MAIQESLAILFWVILLLLGGSALLVGANLLVAPYARRAQAMLHSRPGRSFLIGLVNALFFLALGLLVGSGIPPLALLGAFSLLFVIPLGLLLGLLVGAGWVGETLDQQLGRTSTRPRSLIWGNIILILSTLVPIFGWLFFLGIVLTGLGAALTTLVQQNPAEPTSAQPEA